MKRHLCKLLDAIWTISMGLFLGLTAGLVLAVILTFRGTRLIDASPGVEPYDNPVFAGHHNDAVAGYIGQSLFMVGGSVALVLLGIALIARIATWCLAKFTQQQVTGVHVLSIARSLLLGFCVVCMIITASVAIDMNDQWPGLYDTAASDKQLIQRRDIFDHAHQYSEKMASYAWFSGLIAFAVSPWCRRLADEPTECKSDSTT